MTRKSVLRTLTNIVLLYLAVNVAYNFYRQYKAGEDLSGRNVSQLSFKNMQGKTVRFSDISGPKVIAFWATWCGPCTLELSRLNDLVKENKIPKDKLFPISIGEEQEIVAAAAKERDYVMDTYWDEPGSTQKHVPVIATPTIVYIDANQKITDVDTGINPMLSQKVQRFLTK